MINFTAEDIAFVKKAIEIRDKGYYIQSQTLTNYYNKILGKNVKNTSCSSCCRGRITELQNALRQWEQQEAKKAQEALKNDEPNNSPSEAKEAVTEAEKEEINDVNNSKPHKAKRGKTK